MPTNSKQERDINLHAKQSLLFWDNTQWEKKNSSNKFDVTMGSYDVAETCEAVGCYLISILTKNTVKTSDFTETTV